MIPIHPNHTLSADAIPPSPPPYATLYVYMYATLYVHSTLHYITRLYKYNKSVVQVHNSINVDR